MKNSLYLFIVIFLLSCTSKKQQLKEDIIAGEAVLFNDSVKSLNTTKANEVFSLYIKYADEYKDDTASAAYLFKAGDLANGLRRSKESLEIYERLRRDYPDYRKSGAALFMQAFIYETSIQDKEKAKEKYREFLEKYPSHNLAPSAQASLDQLNANLSDEELIRKFEEMNKK